MSSKTELSGEDLLDAGFYSEVIERLRHSLDGPNLGLLIEALSLAGFHQEAVALCEADDKSGSQVPYQRALVLWRSGNTRTALDCLAGHVHCEPNSESDRVKSLLASFEITLGHFQASDASLFPLLDKSTMVTSEFAELVQHSMKTFLIPSEIKDFVDGAPQRIFSLESSIWKKARQLSDLGQHEAAAQMINKMIGYPKTPIGELIMARRAIDRRDPHMAISHINAALRMEGADSNIYTCLGQALHQAGRPSDALTYFETAINRQPRDTVAKIGMCFALIDTQQGSRAVTIVEELYRVNPLNSDIHRCILRLRKQGHKTISAAQVLVKLAVDVGRNKKRSQALRAYLRRP